jgi:hypothetical protein
MLETAKFLKIDEVMDLILAVIATWFKNKNPKEIEKEFAVDTEISEEELAQIKKD